MAEIQMVSHQLKDLQYFNRLNQVGSMPLESNFSFNVNYNQDSTRCRATLYQCVKDKREGPEHLFFVSIEMVGYFSVTGPLTTEDKKNFHCQCYNMLFPYADLLARQVCSMGGMPTFSLLRQTMSPDRVLVSQQSSGPKNPQDIPPPPPRPSQPPQ